MSIDWVMLVPSVVFTHIKTSFSTELKEKYNMTSANFSTELSQDTPAVFPFVKVQVESTEEIEPDLEGDEINSDRFLFRIEVTDNKSSSRASAVSKEILKIMKKAKFRAVGTPVQKQSISEGTYTYIARYRRTLCPNDVL